MVFQGPLSRRRRDQEAKQHKKLYKKQALNYSTGEPHMSILDGWTYLGWTYLRLIYVLRSDYCHDNPGN